MILKRPNWIIGLGLLFQLLGLAIFSVGVMAINMGQADWTIYSSVGISILLIVTGILLFSMKRISIILSGISIGLSACYEAYDIYNGGEFSFILVAIHLLILGTIFGTDKGVFDKHKNASLVQDGDVLTQKTKFYSAVFISLIAYVSVGWYSWPQNNGKELLNEFIALSAENNVECRWAGFFNHRKTGRTTVQSACMPLMDLPEKVDTKEQLLASINKYVITPSISAVSTDPNISTLVTVQIEDNVVTCSEISNGKIIKSWYDSYENYCLP
ncbi:hypothetical protein [Pseudoalteromonas sp.]|uniref:hypothetical protein n=1 Tax=Pseudoalteromonas sp. TaxID=53249 RepID=UPI002355D3A1|nr:hypothetical protein [Pseudoalteromonas sp.]